jgi:hypothetical protein
VAATVLARLREAMFQTGGCGKELDERSPVIRAIEKPMISQ